MPENKTWHMELHGGDKRIVLCVVMDQILTRVNAHEVL